MSTQGIRDFRPEIHFTPATGWINDPNGLVYENGNYHLFAQYYPEPVWGPMHWCHAVSQDLLHWQHLPVALYPDELGTMYSGSAVYDKENTSGFGTQEHPPIVAMYTCHGDTEQQCIAYSTDYVNFAKYTGNPVIPNAEKIDFRDPKVIPNPKGGWSVVLAAGDRVEFYASENLKEWRKTGEFGPEGNHSQGVWECPDLFPLTIDGEEKWILIVSMGRNHENHGARTQYFIGQFDGETFTCDTPWDTAEFIDQSFDNYAGVTFDNAQERIMIAWGTSWIYARQLPTGEFCGYMAMPRKMELVHTPKGGLRLATPPVAWPFQEAPCGTGDLPGELFGLKVKGSGAATIRLENSRGQHFDFGVNEKGEIFIDRSQAGYKGFNEYFFSDWYSKISAPRYYEGEWELELHFDHSICELYADQYTRAFTQLMYPDTPYTKVAVAQGQAQVEVYAAK